MTRIFEMFAIYDNARDYPGLIVVRQFRIDPSHSVPIPVMPLIYRGHDLMAARASIPGRDRRILFPRDVRDDPSVVETWI